MTVTQNKIGIEIKRIQAESLQTISTVVPWANGDGDFEGGGGSATGEMGAATVGGRYGF